MTDRERKFNVSEDTFDKMIKEAIELEMNDGKDKITDEELIAMGYPLPPSDMLDRIKKSDDVRVADYKKPKYKKSVLLVAAIVFLLSVCITMSVSGSREYLFNIASKITNNSIQFLGMNENKHVYSTEESEAYKNADETAGFTILKPTYMPEGFKFERIKIFPDDRVNITYVNDGKRIILLQTLLKEKMQSGEMVDIKNGDTYIIKAHDTDVTIGEYMRKEKGTKWYSAVWYNENIMYTVDSDCSKSEFEKFIKSLE